MIYYIEFLKTQLLKAYIYVQHFFAAVKNLLSRFYKKAGDFVKGKFTILKTLALDFKKVLIASLLRIKKYKKTLIISGFIFILLAILAILYANSLLKTKTYYIAYIGRSRNIACDENIKNESINCSEINRIKNFDRLHEAALKKYLDELNADLYRVRLNLKIFSIEEDPAKSRQIYEQISEDHSIVVVIDNTWGNEIEKVADIIREKNIPVIAANADKQNNDFAKNAVFIGHGDNVPRSVTDFSIKILESKHLIFVAEENFVSTNIFDTEFKNSGIEISRFGVSSSKVDQREESILFKALDLELEKWRQRGEKPTVILNTHSSWGIRIINYLDTKSEGVTILGGPYISNSNHERFGENNNGNRLIMLTDPSDAVINKVYNDLKDISIDNPKTTGVLNAQLFVKRCLDAVSIIRRAFFDESNENLKSTISRSDFINFFRNKLVGNEFIGKYDLYAFNENLLLRDDKNFEERLQGEKSSYPKQLNSQEEIIPNVYFGIEVVNISNVDIANRSFHADFFYWLKYDKNYDIEKYIHFRNEKQQDSSQEIALDETNGSTVYKLYKKSADFSIDVDFRKFPFDTQELKIELALIKPSDYVLISFDYEGFKDSKKKAEEFNVNDWYIEDFYVTVDNFITTSSRGGQSLINKKPRKFKTLTVRTPIHRRIVSPLLTIILPLMMIGFSAVAVLLIKDDSFTEISSAIFLSIVTYSIGFAQLTPRTNTLTIADSLFYFTFIVVLLVFLKVILFNSNLIKDKVKEQSNKKATLIWSVAFACYSLIVIGILLFG